MTLFWVMRFGAFWGWFFGLFCWFLKINCYICSLKRKRPNMKKRYLHPILIAP